MDWELLDRGLVRGLASALVATLASAWFLYHRDHEAKRLFKLAISWRPLKPGEKESERLAEIKRRMVMGYWIFLFIGISGGIYCAIRIARSLKWF